MICQKGGSIWLNSKRRGEGNWECARSSNFRWRCPDLWRTEGVGKKEAVGKKEFGQLLEGTVEWPWLILGGKVPQASGTVSERP